MSDDNRHLVIVSPVRNEAEHIERVVRAVAAQTRPPDEWIVVDDASEDATLEILRELEPTVPFMRVIEAPQLPAMTNTRDRLAMAAAPRVFNAGLRASQGEFTHVGKLDGDVELPPEYFERMFEEFDADPNLGIVGGTLVERFDDEYRRIPIPPHHVHGALKLYTRRCYDAIGGVHERLGWDTIDETYARMRGFTTRSPMDVVGLHHRHWGSAQGRLRGRARHGTCAWITHYPLSWVTARSVKIAAAPPLGLSGLAFLFGYISAAVTRVPRVEDDEFRRYARRELRGRVIRAVSRRGTSAGAAALQARNL